MAITWLLVANRSRAVDPSVRGSGGRPGFFKEPEFVGSSYELARAQNR